MSSETHAMLKFGEVAGLEHTYQRTTRLCDRIPQQRAQMARLYLALERNPPH